MGMLAGSLVVSYISSKSATWIAMILLLGIHLGMNYMAVRAVCLNTLNRQRANIVFSPIIAEIMYAHNQSNKALSRLQPTEKKQEAIYGAHYKTPQEVYLQERIFERDGVLRGSLGPPMGYCKLGVQLQKMLDALDSTPSLPQRNLPELLRAFEDLPYLIWYDECRQTVLVVFKTSSPDVHLMAWFHALLFALYRADVDEGSGLERLKEIGLYLDEFWGEIRKRIEEKGWDVDADAMLTRESCCIQIGE